MTIEDPFDEDDWSAWSAFTGDVGGKFQVVGDDLTVTNPTKIQVTECLAQNHRLNGHACAQCTLGWHSSLSTLKIICASPCNLPIFFVSFFSPCIFSSAGGRREGVQLPSAEGEPDRLNHGVD